MKATFFPTPADFRRWLQQHHASSPELWVGFYKKHTGRQSITWPESVDEALCVGWIDGLRRSLDEDRYVIRFTPRKRGSIWSAVNTRRAKQLVAEGRMAPAGLEAFKLRDPKKSGIYAFEQRKAPTLDPAAANQFRRERAAWTFFQSQPPGYRRTAIFWVTSAKQEATRQRRLARLIADCAAGQRIGPLRRPAP